MEINPLLFFSLVEALMVFVLCTFILGYLYFSKKGKQSDAVQNLVKKLKKVKKTRITHHSSFLINTLKYEESLAKKIAQDFVKTEMAFYERIVSIFSHNNLIILERLDKTTGRLIDCYQKLKLPASASSTEIDTAGGDENGAEINQLKTENQRLSDELRATMDTMGKMLSEYTTMYGGGEPPDNTLISKMLKILRQQGEIEGDIEDESNVPAATPEISEEILEPVSVEEMQSDDEPELEQNDSAQEVTPDDIEALLNSVGNDDDGDDDDIEEDFLSSIEETSEETSEETPDEDIDNILDEMGLSDDDDDTDAALNAMKSINPHEFDENENEEVMLDPEALLGLVDGSDEGDEPQENDNAIANDATIADIDELLDPDELARLADVGTSTDDAEEEQVKGGLIKGEDGEVELDADPAAEFADLK